MANGAPRVASSGCRRRPAALVCLLAAALGITRAWADGNASPSGARRLSLLVLASDRDVWARIAKDFEAAHPGVAVNVVEGPNATDLRENLYTASLLAGDESLDLVYMDVTWTPKFARWLLPLDAEFPPAALAKLLPAAVDAGRFGGRLYRVPVRTDVGVLFYRRDLLEGAGLVPPRTFDDLTRIARALQAPPRLWGFVWQGSQYEGLVCTYLEVLRGHGGFWVDARTLEVGLDRREAVEAADFLVRSRAGAGAISPPGVTAYKEEESRRLFQDGRAVFLRNWPYAWRLAQERGSPVAGKVGVLPMVHSPGGTSAGTLGGWGLGVSRFSRDPALAAEFIRHVVSPAGQRALCGRTGYAPALAEAYRDPELLAANPLLPDLLRIHENAVARPAIPDYAAASDVLQRHLSAALAGLATPGDALRDAARETRLLLAPGAGKRAVLPWRDGRFRASLRNTAVFTGFSVALELLLGLGAALLLHETRRGRGLLRAVTLLPWALPTAVMALAWAWIFNDSFGVANDLLHRAGLAREPVAWLSSRAGAMAALVVADVWKTTPFVALILLAGLQGIPAGVLEAARVDGLTASQRFRRVVLPLLVPSILAAALFRAVQAFGAFDIVYVMTGGGPGGSTETVSLYAFETYFRYLEPARGAWIAVNGLLLPLALAGLVVRLARPRWRRT
jgi:multiple sugar transport system substrate-binding protein